MKIFIATILIFILGLFKILDPMRDYFILIVGAHQYSLRNLAVDLKEGYKFYSNLHEIRDENLQLLNDISELQGELLKVKIAQEENTLLREQLDLIISTNDDKQLLFANVLGNPSDKTGTSIVLDQGTTHGVKVGNNVIVGNNLIGVVSEVFMGRSIVNLITSSKPSITVYDIDSSDRTEGIVTGEFGTSIVMHKILPNETVTVGDKILTSGRDGIFEPGLLVGTVSRIEGNASEPLRSALITSLIDFSKLDKVFIVQF